MRICGDFKTTVNRALKTKSYPLPRVEELFTKMSGGKSFTKLDMSNAYLQLPPDEESSQLVTINTHKGLFKYDRLPFGVSSAPAIFQHCMESLLREQKGATVLYRPFLEQARWGCPFCKFHRRNDSSAL